MASGNSWRIRWRACVQLGRLSAPSWLQSEMRVAWTWAIQNTRLVSATVMAISQGPGSSSSEVDATTERVMSPP